MKAAIYARVSTQEQTAENQMVLSQWAAHLGHEVIAVYQENETAWKAGHQTELARLIADAQRGRFQAVLVWALDGFHVKAPWLSCYWSIKCRPGGAEYSAIRNPGPWPLGSFQSCYLPWPAG